MNVTTRPQWKNDSSAQNELNTITSYLNYVSESDEICDMSYMVGMLAALIIINKDRFERFPEESRAWFYTVLGPHNGESAWKVYWQFLRQYKEKMFTSEDAWV